MSENKFVSWVNFVEQHNLTFVNCRAKDEDNGLDLLYLFVKDENGFLSNDGQYHETYLYGIDVTNNGRGVTEKSFEDAMGKIKNFYALQKMKTMADFRVFLDSKREDEN